MLLLRKGERPIPICRECRAVHEDGVCPKAAPMPFGVLVVSKLRQDGTENVVFVEDRPKRRKLS